MSVCASAVLLLASVPIANAADPDAGTEAKTRPKLKLSLHGDYLVRSTWLSSLTLDADNTLLGQTAFVEHRLRLSPAIKFHTFELRGELDVWDGLVAGDESIDFTLPRRSRDEVRVLPRGRARYLYAIWSSPIGRLQAGVQGSRWGLGLLASDGTGRDDDFGDNLYGDRSLRFLFATRPIMLATRGKKGSPLGVAAAFDMVLEDSTVRWTDGDRAFQGVLAVLWSEAATGKAPEADEDAIRELGIYAVYRSIKDGRGEKISAFVVDAYGKLALDLGGEATLTLAAEGALIVGGGTIARSLTAPDGHDLLSAGAVARATVRRGIFDVILEVGYASGDADPGDDGIHNFKFNPDFNVGLIMFDEALAWQSARAADRAADPKVIGIPPNGITLIPTNGSITNAVYFNARHRTRIWRNLDVLVGLLYAFAPSPVVDPFNSFRAGGAPRSYLGGEVGRSYGFETDLAITWRIDHAIFPSAWTLQGGVLLPGGAFNGADGYPMDPVWELMLRLWLTW